MKHKDSCAKNTGTANMLLEINKGIPNIIRCTCGANDDGCKVIETVGKTMKPSERIIEIAKEAVEKGSWLHEDDYIRAIILYLDEEHAKKHKYETN